MLCKISLSQLRPCVEHDYYQKTHSHVCWKSVIIVYPVVLHLFSFGSFIIEVQEPLHRSIILELKTSCLFTCLVFFYIFIQEAAVSGNKLLLCWYCVSIFPRRNQCNQRLFIPCTKLSRLSTNLQILAIRAQQHHGKRYFDSLLFWPPSHFHFAFAFWFFIFWPPPHFIFCIFHFDFWFSDPPPHFAFHPKCSDITVVWQTNSFLTRLTSSWWCWRGNLWFPFCTLFSCPGQLNRWPCHSLTH